MAPSMWQQTEEMAKKHDQGGSLWLKLGNDGDKAVVVFLGEPHPREVCFVDGKYMPFDEKLKAQGLKPSLRVALSVALYDSKEVKVLEQGVMFFKDLVRVREKYGLEKWAFEIQRHGAAKDPKTTYSILPEHQLSAEQQKAFQALPQHDLEKLYAPRARAAAARRSAATTRSPTAPSTRRWRRPSPRSSRRCRARRSIASSRSSACSASRTCPPRRSRRRARSSSSCRPSWPRPPRPRPRSIRSPERPARGATHE
jgi:hypothetical protein